MWTLLACATLKEAPQIDVHGLVNVADVKAAVWAPSPGGRVVNFWATWCAPCIEELPRLAAWGRAHPDVDLLFVNLDLPKARDRFVLPFLKKTGLADLHHVQLDHRDPAVGIAGVVSPWGGDIPLTIVVGPDGAERRRLAGSVADPERELVQ